jgi:hypothetical protein
MSNDPEFRCPVCRARQPLQEICRRCKADLSLVVQVRRRIEYLVAEHKQARERGDIGREQFVQAELEWLAPNR